MSATPVGDFIRRRYPDNPGATHYLGSGDDPGCCAGPHPACTYGAGFREGVAVEREAARERTSQAMQRFSRTAELAQAKAIERAVAAERERIAQSAEIQALAHLAEGSRIAADALKCFADLIRNPEGAPDA